MSEYYILIGKTPVATDARGWAAWAGKNNPARVAVDDLDDCRVSTVFLGLNHTFNGGRPVLFETMIFGGPLDGEMER
jgi:hypothetical protein